MKSDQIEVDARRMPCPMPLLKLKQALNGMDVGDSLHLIATDPTSKRDIVTYINMTEHQISYQEDCGEIHFFVTKC